MLWLHLYVIITGGNKNLRFKLVDNVLELVPDTQEVAAAAKGSDQVPVEDNNDESDGDNNEESEGELELNFTLSKARKRLIRAGKAKIIEQDTTNSTEKKVEAQIMKKTEFDAPYVSTIWIT